MHRSWMRRYWLFLIAALVASSAVGKAQEDEPNTRVRPNSQADSLGAVLNLPLPATAFRYSLLTTLVSAPTLVLTVPGLIVGPATGYFYGDKPGRAFAGMGLRLAGVGGMISAFAICGWDCGEGDDAYDIAWMVFGASSALVVGSAVYDIATVKEAVRRNNEKRLGKVISLAPEYSPKTKVIGLRLRVAF